MHRSGAYCKARLGSVARRVCAIAHRAQLSWKRRRNEALLTKERARQIMGHTDRATRVELAVCGARSGDPVTVCQHGLGTCQCFAFQLSSSRPN